MLPIITLGGILPTMVIHEYEDSKVASFNVPVVYLQIDLPKEKFTLSFLEGNFWILCVTSILIIRSTSGSKMLGRHFISAFSSQYMERSSLLYCGTSYT